jgi:hypothetical protein
MGFVKLEDPIRLAVIIDHSFETPIFLEVRLPDRRPEPFVGVCIDIDISRLDLEVYHLVDEHLFFLNEIQLAFRLHVKHHQWFVDID